MSRLLVRSFGVSLDGFGAGPAQSVEHPLGVDGPDIMQWFFPTRVFQSMHGSGDSGETGVDNGIAEKGFENVGAWIMGRNMFGPVRGPWPDDSWRGWWGDEPPYHCHVFVLTHHARKPLEMKGGTIFHFVTDGPRAKGRDMNAESCSMVASDGPPIPTSHLDRDLSVEIPVYFVAPTVCEKATTALKSRLAPYPI